MPIGKLSFEPGDLAYALPLRLVVADETNTYDIVREDTGELWGQAVKMGDGWDYDRYAPGLTRKPSVISDWECRGMNYRSPLSVLEAAIEEFEAFGRVGQ